MIFKSTRICLGLFVALLRTSVCESIPAQDKTKKTIHGWSHLYRNATPQKKRSSELVHRAKKGVAGESRKQLMDDLIREKSILELEARKLNSFSSLTKSELQALLKTQALRQQQQRQSSYRGRSRGSATRGGATRKGAMRGSGKNLIKLF